MSDCLPLWSVVTARPSLVSPEDLHEAPRVRQCRLLGRAKSRVAFARMLIAAGVEYRSEAAVSRWVNDFGGVTRNRDDLAAVTDDRLYVVKLNAQPDDPRVPYPERKP